MEQCPSEQTGRYKAALAARLVGTHANGERLLVDLTGGFGVDSALMAPAFTHATYVERSEALCDIARHNFPLLGLPRAEVVCADGTQYLQSLLPVSPLESFWQPHAYLSRPRPPRQPWLEGLRLHARRGDLC